MNPVLHLFVYALVTVPLVFAARLVLTDEDREIEALVLQALIDCLARAHIQTKVACSVMGMDRSQWSQIEQGRPGHHMPSLTKLLRLPWEFWFLFVPELVWIVARKNVADIAQDVRGKRVAS